jgi:phosphoribosylamine--glycine ligase
MNIVVIDTDTCGIGLNMCIRFRNADHKVKYWLPKFPGTGAENWVGDGLVDKIDDWRPWMNWADMIVLTDNCKYHDDLRPYFRKGYPIFGCNPEAAQLELDRELGQEVLKAHSIPTIPYKVFHNYDRAIAHVQDSGKAYVSKPLGDADKGYSYVAKDAADLVCKLEKWKAQNAVKNGFLLQEKVDGVEMAVGGWFGPGGWADWFCENWEEKRLMNDGLGINTGEQGTTLRYVKKSKLFEEALEPCTDYLTQIKYVGYVDMNCMIVDGVPNPLEWTCRFGWPLTNIQMVLHKGDPALWMHALMSGDSGKLRCSERIAVGIVWSHGKYPYEDCKEIDCGYPIYNTEGLEESIHWVSAKHDVAPMMLAGKVIRHDMVVTAGNYVAVCTGTGLTVQKAAQAALDVAWTIDLPSNRMFRTDISKRLEKELKQLKKWGYAQDLTF